MNRQRLFRIGRRVLLGVVLVPLLIWLGLSIGAKLTVAGDVPFMDLAGMVGQTIVAEATCLFSDCDAVLPEGMEVTTFTDSLVQDVTVAIDVDEHGRVYVAETARQRGGSEDNRSHPYWLMDDLASHTIDDRRAYYEKALAEGRFEDPDHFTRNADRVVRIEDEDGDGVADRRTVLVEWNEMVSGLIAGVEAREGTLWVTSVPSIYRLRDEDGDGLQEGVEELHRGFGVKTSLAGHDLHGLVWGPDGKLYFSMGDRGYHIELPDGRVLEPSMGPGRGAVFRMNGDGSELEVFATGVRNPQELAFDDFGNLFTGDNNGDGGDQARLVYLVEGGETGWAMPYQSLGGDYVRGPWVAEKLWELQHPSQPAWVLPPVAYVANGPAGFTHYPGLGLPSRYANHFFLCDYGYTNSRSGVWSFAVEPKGATFEIKDLHRFAWSTLATDVDFGWNGRMYASIFNQVTMTQRVSTIRHPESLEDPRVAALQAHVASPIREKDSSTLFELLGFPDQRLRIRAQYELVARGEASGLVQLVRDSEADLIPRLHALWAVGQLGRDAMRSLAPVDLTWAQEENPELRAQLAKVAGASGAEWLKGDLEAALSDDEPRVRFFAAQSLGRLGDASSVPLLFELIRQNADEDVYLRHAATHALGRIGDFDAIWARADDSSRSVRLAVLLALRGAADPRIERFLGDADELLRVEAARAIYDVPIQAAMPALGAMAATLEPAAADDQQTGQALHRRVIGANVRLRNESGASALARYAADEEQLESLRRMALEALASYSKPPLRDLAMGFYRPLADAPDEILVNVYRTEGRALVESSLDARALEIASGIGEMPLTEKELLEISRDPATEALARISALQALGRTAMADTSRAAALEAIRAPEPAVRNAARDLLLSADPSSGIESFLEVFSTDGEPLERKHAWRRLGEIDDARASEALRRALDAWQANELDAAVGLEAIRAAADQSSDRELAARATALLAPRLDAGVEARRWALEGGDPEAGKLVFQTYGDCQRCHGSGGGHNAGVGPSLAGVSHRGSEYVLESILDPQAQIAQGFATVVITRQDGTVVSGLLMEESENSVTIALSGQASSDASELGGDGKPLGVVIARTEIASMSDPVTGMPPIGLGLEPEALRDVVAYVMSLE